MLLFVLLLVGCPAPEDTGKIGEPDDTQVDGCGDDDGDGYCVDETDGDCSDSDASIHPGATEICDGIDQDCDGEIDEGVTRTFYLDADADGAGDATIFVAECDAPSGYVENANDCDDAREDVHPGAEEVCDEVDQDCDGDVDEDVGQPVWADVDGDGYGDAATSAVACDVSAGWADNAEDCDDLDADVHPGAEEVCDDVDQDCDGTIDENATDARVWYEDKDGDGHGTSATVASCALPAGYAETDDDCDDLDATAYPGATEVCDGDDETCDGVIDEEVDNDGDGVTGCAGDCDDADPDVRPGADERCNDTDDDCDGTVDEDAVDPSRWYPDGDGDGFGAGASVSACDVPAGFVGNNDDCDDTVSASHPGATESCNNTDDDCDGTADEGFDSDGDGFTSCYGDCDDTSADVSPAAPERCNDLDDDCDGVVDDSAVDPSTWYLDADGDGVGRTDATVDACDAPSGYVASYADCDDTDAGIYPGNTETCDGVDDNCDGLPDDGGVCPCDVDWYDGGTYMFCASGTDGLTARDDCIAYNYHLVRVDDAAEDTWLRETAPTYGATDAWIGLTDELFEGLFGWVYGPSTVPYTNWASGEPNDMGGEDCVTLSYSTLTWVDQDCGVTAPYICEADTD